MRNSEVYAYIERLYDALNSGLPDGDVIGEFQNVLMDFEEEVTKEMRAEAKQKSGFDSNPFFTKLAEADDEKLVDFCERMDEVHPKLGEFMEYLMCRDDPTFFILYGETRTKAVGKSSYKWLYKTIRRIYNVLLTGGSLNDK